jgi:hypothetical protein
MGSNISYEMNYIFTWAKTLALWSMLQQQRKIMVMQNVNIDWCFSHCPAKLHSELWKARETRKKCSQNFDMTVWFVAEKFKQRRLYNSPQGTTCIQNYWVYGLCPSSEILNARKHVSETGSVSILRGGEGDIYHVGSLRKSRPQSLDKIQTLNNSECYTPSSESFRFHQQFSCLPPKPLISLCQLFKL